MQKFQRYDKLFAEQGSFDIPENYAAGIAYKVTPTILVALDVQRIMYNDVASIGNPGPDAKDPNNFFSLCTGGDTEPCKLGGSKGLGFGWTNQTIYKLGVDWNYTDSISLRAGFNYGKSPIPNDQVLFNMLAPATPERAITIGAEYIINPDYVVSVNYMHAFKNTIKGPTAFGPDALPVVGSNAAISMYQDSVGAALEIKF